MIDGMPWPAQLGVAGGGWALAFLLLVNFANGRWFVSRRESDALCRQLIDRAEKAEKNNDMLIGVTADMTAVGHLQKAALDAAIDDAVKRRAAIAAGGDDG